MYGPILSLIFATRLNDADRGENHHLRPTYVMGVTYGPP